MNKEQLIALGLSEEQADKVVAGFGQMIPKSRLDEKIDEVKDLKDQLKDRDGQLEELKKVDAKGLQAKIDELQDANETTKKDYEAKLKETQLSGAVKLALAGKVHDADLVASLIDSKTIELDADGNVTKGLDEQLKTLQESKSFLFVPEKETKSNIKGTKPAENPNSGEGSANIGADFAKMLNDRGTAPSNDNNPWG
ncbi:methyl-accepting chemotaxis protein scaffolding protein [Bacillus sp. OxB-1]|uniref:phage scaffolding protein n=1 Tax=Bacillus sp. (strain OxB-1) TaxID=98228 RepID=UPI0005820BA8|nr:phage scaffolding protein [Bacillus sp. OxB-1]BAQ11312.1 methyl-accepting chemotaxis protein scaffolding protein [Bacillus sp. OxB-1]